MKSNWYKKFFITINCILYFVTMALWISIPDEMFLSLVVSGVSLGLSILLIIFYRNDFYRFYTSAFFKGFLKSLLSIILAFGILGFINYLSYKHPIQWDVTKNKKNSLTNQTIRILKSMKHGLKMTIFSTKAEHPSIQALLELYRLEKPTIDLQFVDIEVRPDLVNQHAIDKSGTILIEYEKKSQQVTTLSELTITNAIIRVSRDKDPILFYSTGHEELSFDNKENEGGSYLKGLLKKASYDVRLANLSTFTELPSFVSALVIWGPKQGFHKSELDVIDNYLKRGGRLMLALDPNINNDRVSDLRDLISKWGVKIHNNLVIDRIKHINGSNGSVPMLDKYNKQHPVTQNFKGQTFFPLVSSLNKVNGSKGKVSLLAQTSSFPASWGEMNLDEFVSGKITYNIEKDIRGPLGLVAAWEEEGISTRMILSGNSTFVINTYRKFSKNFTFFLNSLNWLVNEDRLISFNLPVVNDEPVFISAPQLGIIFYFSVIFAPLGLIIMSILVYRRRIKL